MTAKPIRSMTGFAQVRRGTSVGELTLSLRSVNHRGLDLHFHHSHEFAPFENSMRSRLKTGVGRGHVEIRAGLVRENGASPGLNVPILKQYVSWFNAAAADLGLEKALDLNVLLTLPGVIGRSSEPHDLNADFEAEVLAALDDCLGLFNACREREGEMLATEMLGELSEVERATAQIKELRSDVLPAFQQRLEARLRELLNGSGISEVRIVEEAALLADRSDVQEELTRLSVHAAELRRILNAGGAVGKQIDFLLQELKSGDQHNTGKKL